MKTMRRTSTLSMAAGAVLTAAVAMALTAITQTGAGGAHVFLFAGVGAYMIFLMWPERTRFRRRPLDSDTRHTPSGHRSK
jgi:hypothetical protein